MNAQEYAALSEQVARQAPELAALDADIAQRQPGVDVLQAALDAAKATRTAAATASDAARKALADLHRAANELEAQINATEPGDARAALLVEAQALVGQYPGAVQDVTDADAALALTSGPVTAASEALAAPKSELDTIKAQAEAIRAAIAQCQAAIDASGLTVDTVAVKLAQGKADAIRKIDADADEIYGAVQGNRIEEYRTAESEALTFKAATYAGTVPPSVAAWASAKGWSAQQACDDILTTAAAWRGAQAAIRAARLSRKEQIRTASDAAGVATAMAAWGAFRGAVRVQLGLAG